MQLKMPKKQKVIGLLLFLFFTPNPFARAECTPEQLKELKELATPLKSKMVLYRWGEGRYERERIGKPLPFDVEHVNFSEMVAGKGLYLADSGSIDLAAKYAHEEDPALMEAEVSEGTYFLDLADENKFRNKTSRLHYQNLVKECENFEGLIRYNSSPMAFSPAWAYLDRSPKTTKIREFTGKNLDLDRLLFLSARIGSNYFKNLVRNALKAQCWIPSSSTAQALSCKAPPLSVETMQIQSMAQVISALVPPKRVHWTFGGKCSTCNGGETVDSQLCRDHFPTHPGRGHDGKCYEVVEDMPEIEIQPPLSDSSCSSSPLRCVFRGENQHGDKSFEIENPNLGRILGSQSRSHDGVKSCNEALKLANEKNLVCQVDPGSEIVAIYTSQGGNLPMMGKVFSSNNEDISNCADYVRNARADLHLVCLPSRNAAGIRGFQLVDYSNPLNAQILPENGKFTDAESCFKTLNGLRKDSPEYTTITKKVSERNQRMRDALLNNSKSLPERMSELKENSSQLKILFDSKNSSSGTIESHSLQVLDTFQTQQSFNSLSRIELSLKNSGYKQSLKKLMELTILFHDIGKPLGPQHLNTPPVLKNFLAIAGLSEREIQFANALTQHDAIGEMLQGKRTVEGAKKIIEESARSTGLSLSDFFEIQKAFYISDASFYPDLLEKLFRREPTGKLTISDPRFEELTQMISNTPKMR